MFDRTKLFNLLIFIFTSFSLINCGGVRVLNEADRKEFYSPEFYQHIQAIKRDYATGNQDRAILKLRQVDDLKITDAEKVLKRNLMGVFYFDRGMYEEAIRNFNEALKYDTQDRALISQVYLNLSSSYFKLDMNQDAVSSLDKIDTLYLFDEDKKKFHQLSFTLYEKLGDNLSAVKHYILFLRGVDALPLLQENIQFVKLSRSFFKLSIEEQVRVLEDLKSEKILAVGYLAYQQMEQFYFTGQKEMSTELLNWIGSNFSEFPDLAKLTSNFSYRMENFSKVNLKSIGVVLPLGSPKKQSYAKRALLGIDTAFRTSFADVPKADRPSMYIRDNMGSGVVGASRVKELVEQKYVTAIIGGLFPAEAKKEYEEAKKYGVLYISLSQIYIPKEEKNHLLIEVPGSVESLVSKLMSDKFLEQVGKRGAIFYPESDRGQAFVDEFWRLAKVRGIDIKGVQKFQVGTTDFRDPVKKILGLKFKRERLEELELLEEIHKLQKKGSIRRIQTLPPLIDFDWVFLPVNPNEAVQLIPSFSYYDAFNISFIGVPSWRSKTLSKRSSKLGKLFFLGDHLKPNHEKFQQVFFQFHSQYPKIIETLAFDGMKVVSRVIKNKAFETRDELNLMLLSEQSFEGVSGTWEFKNGLWIKDMAPLLLKKGRVEPLFSEAVEQTQDVNSSEEKTTENDLPAEEAKAI